ncbi:MAG TPA: MFS transporter [Acidimicrobiales bacterium]|nr:MFS transporter [Acidimicrobiales bacterium]
MTTTQMAPTITRESEAPDPKRYWSLAVIAVAQLMIVLDASVVIVALPSAQRALHISIADRQWVMTAYTLAFGSLLLLGGRIADYLGRRRMFIMGLLGFGVASALAGLAQDPAMLFAARALQGAFAAVMAPAALSLLTVTFTEPRERARAFGVYGAIAGGGAAIGLVLGGTLTQLASWRWTLLINVPIALVAAFAASRVVRESSGETKAAYDLPGAVTVTGALFLLVYGFTVAGTHGWAAPLTLALLVGSAVLLAVFTVIELRSKHPLLPMRVVLDRNRGGSYLASLLVGSGMLGTFLFLTYFFQGTLHYSALKTGFAFLPFSGGIIIGAGLASRLLPRIGPRVLMVAGLTMAAAGLLWFTGLTVHSSYLVHVLPPEILVSLGMGMSFVPLSSTALVGVEPKDAGVASALVNTTQQVGGSLGTALLNTVAASAATTALAGHVQSVATVQSAAVHGYTTAFTVSAVLLAGAALVAGVLIRASRHQVGTDAASDAAAVEELAHLEPARVEESVA